MVEWCASTTLLKGGKIKMSKKFNSLSREEQIKVIMNMDETNYGDYEDHDDDEDEEED